MFGFDQDMIFRIPALLVALTVHEYAHARAAYQLGDPTAKFMGRMTLNPIAHLDPLGLIMLWLFKFGWAKPVPINPNNFSNLRKGVLLVSLAGPLSNILVAFIAALAIGILSKLYLMPLLVGKVLYLTRDYNIILAVFNLVPFPPLDGYKVLNSLLPWRQSYLLERLEPYGPLILMLLIYLGIIGAVIYPFQYGLYIIINTVVMLLVA